MFTDSSCAWSVREKFHWIAERTECCWGPSGTAENEIWCVRGSACCVIYHEFLFCFEFTLSLRIGSVFMICNFSDVFEFILHSSEMFVFACTGPEAVDAMVGYIAPHVAAAQGERLSSLVGG